MASDHSGCGEASTSEVEASQKGSEVAVPETQALARTAPISRQITHYRGRNEPVLNNLLKGGLAVGGAVGLIGTGSLAVAFASIPLFIIAVVYGVKAYAHRPKSIQAENTEFKSGDYSALHIWAPFLPAVGWLVAFPLDLLGIESLPVPPLLSALVGGLFFGISGSLGLWATWGQAFRVGKRRIKKLTEKESLEGVTEARMNAIEENGDIFGALVASGAVDGNTIPTKALAKLLTWDEDKISELRARIIELEKLGLIKVTGMVLMKDPKNWSITVTPDGVRNIAQQGKR